MRRPAIAVVAVVVTLLVVVAAVVGVRWSRSRDQTTFEQAAGYAPADAQRLSWTDWAGIRDRLGARLDADSSVADVQSFLDEGYDEDLTSTSALVESASMLQEHFGFSPASVDWELFSQAADGAVVILRLPESTDFDDLGDRLESTGFSRPSADDGVWQGGEDLLPGIGAGITPELQYVALDANDGLVLTSDKSGYLDRVIDNLGDDELPQPVRDVVGASGDSLSAAVYDGDYACSALAMGQADEDDQAEADRLIAAAGEVNPLRAFAMSARPGGHVQVSMAFEGDAQARTNADTRALLAGGPAPGQGGDFTDRFAVDSATADGDLVTLDLAPTEGSYVLSDLSTGPVLFATC